MRQGILAAGAALWIGASGSMAGAEPPDADLAGAPIVIDGDTLDLVTIGRTGRPERVRVRLWGIDAPERGAPGAREAAGWLALMIAEGGGGVACLRAEARDQRAGARVVATCWAGEVGEPLESLSCRLIAAGAAVEMRRFSDGALAECRRPPKEG